MSSPSFQYSRASEVSDAFIQGSRAGTAFVAGGTDLLQLWKAGVMAPEGVVDISRLPLDDIEFADSQLSLGALARLSDVAAHPDVARHHPLIAEAILASASGQIRNMATVGGNLLQRTRCPYFRNEGLACNKRLPGSGCGALSGENRQAALFGASPSCVATHASDLAVALAVASAVKRVALTGDDEGPLACFGELGLTGELRTVAHGDRRLSEAQRFGLTPVIEPEQFKSLRAALSSALTPARQVPAAA